MRRAAFLAAMLCACGQPAHVGVLENADAGAGNVAPGADAGPQPDAGPSAGDCTGLVPQPGAAAAGFEVHDSTGLTCTGASADGKGTIVVEAHSAAALTWNVYDSRGAWLGNFAAAGDLAPQAEGFEGYYASDDWYWNGYGVQGAFVPLQTPAIVVPGFSGGSIAFDASGAHLVDATGNESAFVAAPLSGLLAGAQDASGAAVALSVSGSRTVATWFDFAAGKAATPVDAGAAATAAVARPLIGGGVAVRLDGHWSSVLHPSGNEAAPPWLADNADFTTVLGSRAYATWQPTGAAINIVSAAGHSCGALTLNGISSVLVTPTGTIVGSSGARGCSKNIWNAALR